MESIVLILTMAIVVEALIEYAKSIGKAITDGGWKTAVTQCAAIALSVGLCFAIGGDLFAGLGINFAWPWIGTALTGIIASRGANYVSDFIKKIGTAKGGE